MNLNNDVLSLVKKVLFVPAEFSDLRALEILYQCLDPHLNLDYFFLELPDEYKEKYGDFLENVKCSEILEGEDIVVACYSDWTNAHGIKGTPTLQIDQMILKNLNGIMDGSMVEFGRDAFPPLRDLPTIVFSFVNEADPTDVQKIIDTFLPGSRIYLDGGHDPVSFDFNVPESLKDNLIYVDQYGHLPFLYAAADLSLMGASTFYSVDTLIGQRLSNQDATFHDFNQACVGGPLFVIPPSQSKYGFSELEKAKCIVPCTSKNHLIKSVQEYIDSFSSVTRQQYQQEQRMAQIDFIQTTRQRFLPVILSHILSELGLGDPIYNSDLNVFKGVFNHGNITRLIHKDTQWREDDSVFVDISPPQYNL